MNTESQELTKAERAALDSLADDWEAAALAIMAARGVLNLVTEPLNVAVEIHKLADELARVTAERDGLKAKLDEAENALFVEQMALRRAEARAEKAEKANAARVFATKCALDLDAGRAASSCLHAALADPNLGATIPCDECTKPSGIYVCTGCWEKHRGQLSQGVDTSTPHYDNYGDWVPRAELEDEQKDNALYAKTLERCHEQIDAHQAELQRVAEAVREACIEKIEAANAARLMAAAPELLDAVQLLLGSIEPEHHGHTDQIEAREMARAAIAKAVGEMTAKGAK